MRAGDREKFPECEGIEPENPGPIIFVEMTIELNVTNPSREGLVTFSSMVISTENRQNLLTYLVHDAGYLKKKKPLGLLKGEFTRAGPCPGHAAFFHTFFNGSAAPSAVRYALVPRAIRLCPIPNYPSFFIPLPQSLLLRLPAARRCLKSQPSGWA